MNISKGYGSEFDCPAIYEIKVRGKSDSACLDSFEDLTLSYEKLVDGSVNTVLTGLLADQAALNGILLAIGLLQLVIVSVERVSDCL